jgi:hypothetical protein
MFTWLLYSLLLLWWTMFENSTGTKNSHFIKFGKIWQNSGKFDWNAFDEQKEQEFFENTKIGRIGR